MKDFKAVAIDYEFYLTLSDKPQQVCLTERQMYVLSVQNSYTYWLTRWYNTDDITQKTVEFIAAEIEGLLVMCNCGIPAPTITDTINTNIYITTTSTDYITNNTTYEADGETLTTLAPNMTYATGTPADIDKILCFGYSMLLQTVINQGKGVKQLEAGEDQNLIAHIGVALTGLAGAGGLALGAGGFAASIVAVIGGPWALLGLAVGGIAVGISSLFVTADLSLFEDQEAIDLVLCTLRTNSLGHEPTFEIFSGLLTPNDFPPDSNAEKLAALVQPFLSSLDYYLQFMVSMSELYNTPLLIALPECDVCPVPGCDGGTLFDFTESEFFWLEYNATYHEDEGFGRSEASPGRIQITREYTPRPTRGRVWMNTEGYAIYILNEQSGTTPGPVVGTFEFIAEDSIGFRYEADVIEAYAYRTFISVETPGLIDPAARLLRMCFDYDVEE